LEDVWTQSRSGARASSSDAYDSWRKNQTPSNLKRVIDDLEPTIKSSIRTYVGPRVSPTIDQRAKIIAARAVKKYDPSQKANLNTYVSNQLRELQRTAPQISDPLSPSERFRQNQGEIMTAETEIEDRIGRPATDEEIARATGFPVKRVTKVRERMRARVPMSVYEDSFGEDDDDGAEDIVASEHTDYDDWVDAVYQDLDDIDRLILMHRTGYRGTNILSNREIAMRLDMSPASVSQRAGRVQKRLDEFYE